MNKQKALLMLIVFLAATALSGLLLAQTDDALALEDHMRQVRRKIDEKRNSAIGTILEMTDEQSKVFRPLQKAYGKEIKQVDKKGRDLLRDFSESYDKLNAQSAAEIGKRYFGLKRERLEIQEKYMKQISDEISPVVAVQFIQLERRFDAQLEVERMKYSPLAE